MAIDEPGVVDAIGTLLDKGEVVLTISDHLDWDDPAHVPALQAKLNRYIAFIESGEVFESYPAAKGKRLRIDIVCQYDPVPRGEIFLTNARASIANAGFSLSWRVLAA
jgi:uncharacterized protein DUF6572